MASESIGPISTLLGGGIGMAAGGPAGAMAGAKIGSAVGGLGTMFSGIAKKKQAERARPDLVDPATAARLEEAKRKLKSMESGTDTATVSALRENQRLAEATKSDIAKNTGGNVGGTVDAMLKAQRISGRNVGGVVADSARRASGFRSVVDTLANRIADRKREIQQDKSSQLFAEAAESIQTGSQNAVTSGASLIPTGSGGPGMGIPTGASNPTAPTVGSPTLSTPGIAPPNTYGSGGQPPGPPPGTAQILNSIFTPSTT